MRIIPCLSRVFYLPLLLRYNAKPKNNIENIYIKYCLLTNLVIKLNYQECEGYYE